jgi:hypothetical protein
MSGSADKMNLLTDFRVVIRNPRGQYLTDDATRLFFTDDRTQATVFNFRADEVEQQLELILKTQGVMLLAEPVPPEDIYETCDRCKELFMPYMTFFDGKQFLCADCRSARHQARG